MSLTNKQQRFLRSQAHSLKPIIIIGNAGLTDGVINETNIALETHELIKVRVNAETREDRAEISQQLTQITESDLVQSIGHICIIYRPRKKNPGISLP